MNLYEPFKKEVDNLKQNNQYRCLKSLSSRNDKFVVYNNKKYLNLSSNDYLGLATDKEYVNNFYHDLNRDNIIDVFGPGSTSSRLLAGNFELYTELENLLSGLYNNAIQSENSASSRHNSKHALVFNSGYHANVGIISAIADSDTLILSDQLNHASIIDGTRLSHADYIAFNHFDYTQLESILEEKREQYRKVLVVSESVFSMDGDIADIKKLVEIKNQYDALLYVDEAHAAGLFGNTGLGICERENVIKDVDIIIGTFGKAFASQGAYAIIDPVIRDYLINKTRTLIYTTALPPVTVNWNIYTLKNFNSFKNKRDQLHNISEKLRTSLRNNGIKTDGASQVVPAITGDNQRTIEAAEALQENGFLLFPVRPPTVPHGTSRIRISLTAGLDWEDICSIPEILSRV